MSRTTLAHSRPQARILIVTPTAGGCEALIPETVAAIIIWFLGCIPAMAAAVVIFRQVVDFRRWLRGWREYVEGWREDLELMRVALCMAARLEFA